jgi:hypothetical protein
MSLTKRIVFGLGILALIGGVTGSAKAGIRGVLSVYNQSAHPYHIFVEGRRMGTIYQGQTVRIPVNDWHGPTELVAVQAGSQGRIRFVRNVRTSQFVRWELHTHWEQLRAVGGPEHVSPRCDINPPRRDHGPYHRGTSYIRYSWPQSGSRYHARIALSW